MQLQILYFEQTDVKGLISKTEAEKVFVQSTERDLYLWCKDDLVNIVCRIPCTESWSTWSGRKSEILKFLNEYAGESYEVLKHFMLKVAKIPKDRIFTSYPKAILFLDPPKKVQKETVEKVLGAVSRI